MSLTLRALTQIISIETRPHAAKVLVSALRLHGNHGLPLKLISNLRQYNVLKSVTGLFLIGAFMHSFAKHSVPYIKNKL